MTIRTASGRLGTLAVTLLLAGVSHGALAQVAPVPAEAPAADATESAAAEGDEIVVTGSRIRGVAPVGSSVISVDQAMIAREPATNVVDLLRRVPQVSGAGINESFSGVVGPGVTSSNATRTGAINLRGVGPKATLVLFGGQRLAAAGFNGAQIDPTGIPTPALERVEVVADGASAIYGSDAVAGVVNFIPRTRYNGVDARIRASQADGYRQIQASFLGGINWASGSAVVAYEHYYNSRLRGVDRDYYRSDLTARGGRDYRSNQCNPGNIIVNGISYAIPAGGVTPATANLLVPNTRNLCENYRLGDIMAEQNRDAVYGSLRQELAPGIELWARGFFADRRYNANDTQQGSTSAVANLTVPRTNAYFVAPPGTNPASVTVGYYFGNDLPLRFVGRSQAYQATTGIDARLGGSWKANASASWGRTKDVVNAYFAFNTALTTALASSNPAIAFNPFGGGNSQAVNDNVFSSYLDGRPISHVFSGQLGLNGNLFDIGGGAVRLATGFDYSQYKFHLSTNSGTKATGVRTISDNARKVYSGFAELYVPLFGAPNARAGLQRLELSMAGRYDHYSDVGNTFNPKFGLNWSPVGGLTFKGSYGTSFRAPFLADTLSPRSGAALVVTTSADPQSPTGSSTGLQINDGRAGLVPESATTYTLGAEWRPAAVPGLTASLTWFDLDYKDEISAPVINTVLVNPVFAGSVIRNPTAQQVADLIATSGLPIRGVLPTTVNFIFDGRPSNLGGTRTNGFDFALNYDRKLGWGDVYGSLSGTYLTRYDVRVTKIAPARDVLNTIYYPPRFRANAEFGWSNNGVSASTTVRYLNSYRNNLITPEEKVRGNVTVDLRLGYTVEDGPRWLKGTSVDFQVSNVFDRDPPYVNVQGGVDPSAASLIGRMFTVTLGKKW